MSASNTTYFSYLDQFTDIEINLAPLTNYYSNNNFKFEFSNYQPLQVKIKNLFEQTQIINQYLKQTTFFSKYQIIDNEKIEFISYKFYGIKDYWWIICIFNNIKNPFTEWIYNDKQLSYLANLLYEKENKYSYETYYKILFEENEKKRMLNILKIEHVNQLVYDFIMSFSSK